MLVIVILSGYLFGNMDGAIVGLIVGFLRDIFTGYTPGLGMLIGLYSGVLGSFIFSKRFHSRFSLAFVQVILVTFIYKSLGHVLRFLFFTFFQHAGSYFSLGDIILNSILPQILANLIGSIPLLILLKYLGPYTNQIDHIHSQTIIYADKRL